MATDHTSRKCLECGQTKSVSEFHRDAIRADGSQRYRSKCRGCVSHARAIRPPEVKAAIAVQMAERAKKRWAEKPDEMREKERERYRRDVASDPEKVRERTARYARNYTSSEHGKQTRRRNARLRRLRMYGLTPESHQALLEIQDGRCAICRVAHSRTIMTDNLFIDHDHETDKARGLLCARCNHTLGAMGDNIAGVTRYLRYLESPPAQSFLS